MRALSHVTASRLLRHPKFWRGADFADHKLAPATEAVLRSDTDELKMSGTGKVGLGVAIENEDGSYCLLPINCTVPSSNMDVRAVLSARYPYDCAKSHCILLSGQCGNDCCMQRIKARAQELRATIKALGTEIENLRGEARQLADHAWKQWQDSIEFVTYP